MGEMQDTKACPSLDWERCADYTGCKGGCQPLESYERGQRPEVRGQSVARLTSGFCPLVDAGQLARSVTRNLAGSETSQMTGDYLKKERYP